MVEGPIVSYEENGDKHSYTQVSRADTTQRSIHVRLYNKKKQSIQNLSPDAPVFVFCLAASKQPFGTSNARSDNGVDPFRCYPVIGDDDFPFMLMLNVPAGWR